jgi:hypothetical protein
MSSLKVYQITQIKNPAVRQGSLILDEQSALPDLLKRDNNNWADEGYISHISGEFYRKPGRGAISRKTMNSAKIDRFASSDGRHFQLEYKKSSPPRAPLAGPKKFHIPFAGKRPARPSSGQPRAPAAAADTIFESPNSAVTKTATNKNEFN